MLDEAWGLFIDKTRADLMLSLVERVTLYPESMAISWNLQGWSELLREIPSAPGAGLG